LLTKAVIALCRRYSLFDHPRRHKRHKVPVPTLGGTAILIAFWVGIIVYLLLDTEAFPGIRTSLPNILIGSLLIYGVGLADDLRPVSAWVKLAAQVAAGLLLYFGGLSINLLSLPILGTTALNGLSVVITVFWVIALSNAINLIDGLDGLAAGVSLIAAAAMMVVGIIYMIDSVILFSLVLEGALLAFWFFNRYPARVFLGDCGSLLIGYIFAVISLVVPIKSFTTAALFMPLVVLGVPLTETVSSFLRRLAAGKNVMKADRRHIFHYLAYAGLSHRQIVYLFYLSGLFFGLISIGMLLFNRMLVLSLLLLFMVVIFVIYFIFMTRMRKGRPAK
jgi:UDP-GlcNAc:undecaprenyl-phosphate GlcNAc-1-phosphate transferase